MRTIAPAKINWTLEVLGRREDGYHEIRSVMQTIDLCDELSADRSDDPVFETTDGASLAEDDLIVKAAEALEERVGRALPAARLRVEKRIPLGSGLGGGSSDAAAALRSLDRLWGLKLRAARLTEMAAKLGSDVAFFLYSGTALVEGRGEHVTALPEVPERWVVLVIPPLRLPNKTKRMYEAISSEDFSDGSRTESLSKALRAGKALSEEGLCNAFERVAYNVFQGLECYRDALLASGADRVHLAGAGPAMFALAEDEAAAREMCDRVQAPGPKVFVARTLGADEATAVTD